MNLIEFYKHAKKVCIAEGYEKEIQMVEERKFDQINSDDFFREYAWVVISSGISNKAAISVFTKLMETRKICSVKHKFKQQALKIADYKYLDWFSHLQKCKTDKEKIEYIQTLPYMGPATSYHFARNLGIDCAKPDRHLKRIAEHFLFFEGVKHPIGQDIYIIANEDGDVQSMCRCISNRTGDRIGTVDIVLWRVSVVMPPWKQKEGDVPGW